MFRTTAAIALVLCLSLVGVGEVSAQRSGFIIGLGIGPGVTSSASGPLSSTGGSRERETKMGFATDFKIGAQVGTSTLVYYSNKAVFMGDEDNEVEIAGVMGLGLTYVLPSAPVHLSSSVGVSTYSELDWSDDYTEVEAGLGLTAGVGYEFADLWIVDFGVAFGSKFSVLQVKLGINILSH
jgi:hypothetical protein